MGDINFQEAVDVLAILERTSELFAHSAYIPVLAIRPNGDVSLYWKDVAPHDKKLYGQQDLGTIHDIPELVKTLKHLVFEVMENNEDV